MSHVFICSNRFESFRNALSISYKTIKNIFGFTISGMADALLLPGAGLLALVAKCYKSNFDPTVDQIKKNKTPILFIHGNGYNEMQWIYGRYFLSKDKDLGSIFSLNLDGLLSNDPKNGIEEYSKKVEKKVREILQKTGEENGVILIGHSMGGIVASHVAENNKNLRIKKIITISTPWEIPPLLVKLTNLTGRLMPSLFKTPKRYQQMRDEGQFLSNLKTAAQASKIPYYSLYSERDAFVPGERGELTAENSRKFSYQGHYTPMISSSVWKQIQIWLKEANE